MDDETQATGPSAKKSKVALIAKTINVSGVS